MKNNVETDHLHLFAQNNHDTQVRHFSSPFYVKSTNKLAHF